MPESFRRRNQRVKTIKRDYLEPLEIIDHPVFIVTLYTAVTLLLAHRLSDTPDWVSLFFLFFFVIHQLT
jgi:hypothetical protein